MAQEQVQLEFREQLQQMQMLQQQAPNNPQAANDLQVITNAARKAVLIAEMTEEFMKEEREITSQFDHDPLLKLKQREVDHPLSCVLEWVIARLNSLDPNNIISFSSKTIPVLAILRANLLEGKETLITYSGELPGALDLHILRNVYGYTFDLKYVNNVSEIPAFHGKGTVVTKSPTGGQPVAVASQNIIKDPRSNKYQRKKLHCSR